MTGLDLISKRLGDLSKLPEKRDTIFLGDVRKEFRADLQSFIVGETLGVQDGKPVIGKNLYNSWLKKIRTKGFDYEIKFR